VIREGFERRESIALNDGSPVDLYLLHFSPCSFLAQIFFVRLKREQKDNRKRTEREQKENRKRTEREQKENRVIDVYQYSCVNLGHLLATSWSPPPRTVIKA
jgi:hypothetical protein